MSHRRRDDNPTHFMKIENSAKGHIVNQTMSYSGELRKITEEQWARI